MAIVMITDEDLDMLMSLGRDKEEQEEENKEGETLEYWYNKIYKDYHYNVHETIGLKAPYMDKLGDYCLRECNKNHGNNNRSYIKSLKQIRDSNRRIVCIGDSEELESLNKRKIKRLKTESDY